MASIKIVKRTIQGSDKFHICVGYYHKQNNTKFSTGVKVEQEFISDDTLQVQPISRKLRGYTTLNQTVLAVKTKVQNIVNAQIAIGGDLSIEAISALYNPAAKPKEKKTLVDLWAAYLESIKDTLGSWRTFNSYSNSFQTSAERPKEGKKKRKAVNFREFLKKEGMEDITPEKFTINHYRSYVGYLKKKVKPNTAAKRLKHLKQFLSHLVNDLKLPVGFDLNKITYKETAGLKLSLSKDELQAYIDADLPKHLVKVRDLAVIQCATGLRISDRQRIDKNIKGNKIVIEAQKTRSRMEIPITPQIRKILEKYNYELPELSEQNYRAGIKEIHRKLFPEQKVQVREGNGYKDVHVWEEISSHDMVRTFISLSAEKGMPIPAIATITGKSVATLLKNYLVVSQKFAEEEMEKAWGASPLKVAR
jgi:integrase